MDYFEIGQRIRKIRRAKRLSQEQLAEMTGISVTHMSHIETGNTKLSIEVFHNIVNALECTSDEILFDIKDNNLSTIEKSIADTLEECTAKELFIMHDTIKALKVTLEKYK